MQTCSKSLVIFTLFAVFWLELKAHRCGFPHKKTHKTTKLGEGKSSTTTPATTSTTAKGIKENSKCNTGTVPSCKCDLRDDDNYPAAYITKGLYYPVPKSGNCTDVFKRSSTTPSDYHFREEKCHKVRRTVCTVDSSCFYLSNRGEPILPTPDSFIIGQNTSAPNCECCCRDDVFDHLPMPKSGNCTDLLETTYNYSGGCDKMQTFCTDTCHCNDLYVDPTKCDPQTCNNVSAEAFCMCGIEDGHQYNNYPMPKSGNCMDNLEIFAITPGIFYRSAPLCYKARKVCKCEPMTYDQTAHCACKDECVSGCGSFFAP